MVVKRMVESGEVTEENLPATGKKAYRYCTLNYDAVNSPTRDFSKEIPKNPACDFSKDILKNYDHLSSPACNFSNDEPKTVLRRTHERNHKIKMPRR